MDLIFLITFFLYGLLVFFRPFWGIIIFLFFIQVETAAAIYANIPYFDGFEKKMAQLNRYIILILSLRSLILFLTRFKNIKTSNNLSSLFVSILIFTVWSFFSVLWMDSSFHSTVTSRLLQLTSFIAMVFVFYESINNRDEFVKLMIFGYAFNAIKLFFTLIFYMLTGENVPTGVDIGLIVFATVYLFSSQKYSHSFYGFIFVLLGFSSIIIGSSRRAFLILAIAIAMILYYNFSKKLLKSFFIISFIGLIAINVSRNSFFDYKIEKTVRVFTQGYNTKTMTGRDKLWNYGLIAISEKPILGHGYGTNERAIAKTSNIPGRKIRVHNSYLKVWIELGVIGLFILSAIFISHFNLLRTLSKKLRLGNDYLFYCLVFSKYVAWTGLIFFAVFGWSAYLGKSFWLLLSYTLIARKIINKQNKNLGFVLS